MPTAPTLAPDQMAQAQATAGINPVNFLIATADMHSSGQLSAPVPQGKDALAPALSKKSSGRKIRVVK